MKKTGFLALILVLALLVPAAVSAAEIQQPLSPRIEATHQLGNLPDHWNPMKDLTDEAALLLQLTGDTLYTLSPDGSTLIPSLAVSLPVDVTAEFAGQYGIAPGTERGYAFQIKIDPAAGWDDGSPISAEDFIFTFDQLIEGKRLPVELANLESYYSGAQKASGSIISLHDAGFSSVEEAEITGHSLFYVDTSRFWGLDAGWVSFLDRTRLKDAAIPSGVTEMYVSGAYLYDRYLRTGCDTDEFQSRFVGICAEPEYTTRDDIGLVLLDRETFVLILSRPSTERILALRLRNLYPVPENLYGDNYATSEKNYRSCGAYRVVSVTGDEFLLEPNPHWHGKRDVFQADLIRLMP